ncbi:hypothetical protein CC85DRAFT_305247 [Cutaneotrichosporon oleaginosum]|uniref:Uncharacterized protein n=1 Tax=Cutaneotrichosporon oleaginosum TaxID=879819 RepID=A0A0J0XDY9_9TREE|nr:uncharacterized protein CC85DRAFT_305247 [Cutaneotrichosporon oleaginosum]KLT39228.1 hypothetical protein CC85DRAFT_305247 [Cutaneotrichosporon oleaginosum]TXT05721.1 hypothetical protein COLE_07041 [Cutaneotrichosporon oleaginosum]
MLAVLLLIGAAAAPLQPLRPPDTVVRNLTHMSPLLTYDGDVDYVFGPPRTPDGSMAEDISFSHHILKEGASAEFVFAGSAFFVNGWADAVLRVSEYPLHGASAGRAQWWHVTEEAREVRERTLVAVLGNDGPRRVRLDVTSGEVWLSRVVTHTDVPPSTQWGAPHWPIMDGWRGVRERMGAVVKGIWRETYVDFADIGVEQPVAWGLGSYDTPEDEDDDYAHVTLSPALGASCVELRGATPLPSMGEGRYRVLVDPPLAGHSEVWRRVHPVGPTPADIVLFSAVLDPSMAFTVTLQLQGVGWHWASAWFLAEMGVQPLPPWIGRGGRVRRVFDPVRGHIVLALSCTIAVATIVLGFVLACRRVRTVDAERTPLLDG